MFRKTEDFLAQWPVESEGTLTLLRALTDASLAQRVDPEGRTLGRIAWHITQSIQGMANRTGLSIGVGDLEQAPVPREAREIAMTYERLSAALLEAVRGWSDETLLETNDIFGRPWAKGFTLDVLVRHQAHHRGQMTVLMRQAGLPVHGVYGAAREEWAARGMPTRD
jgi:uncharacterized damage-inducible protein DinB